MKFAVRLGLVLAMAFAVPAAAEPAQTPVPATTGALTVECDRKGVTCGVLESCAEACEYLRQCGLNRLDRDTDGIPCETLCTRPCDAQG